jgi:hypothetical protein
MAMHSSAAVQQGLAAFYAAYSSHDPARFADALASGDGVSVFGTAPGEGRPDRDAWIEGYSGSVPELGLRLEGGPRPRGYAEDGFGFALDEPRFVLPSGRYVPARLTAVLRMEDGRWRVAHVHFSVGVPDEQAWQGP